MSSINNAFMMTSSDGTSVTGRHFPLWIIPFCLFAFPVIFQFLSPTITAMLHPEFALLKNGATVAACTEDEYTVSLSSLLPTPLTLCPQTASDKTIYCVYNGTDEYTAPRAASPEQITVCPTLVSDRVKDDIADGMRPVHPVDELSYRIYISTAITIGIITVIELSAYIRRKIILASM
jgi:hypothetical protein